MDSAQIPTMINIKQYIPIVGKIIKDRNSLLVEINNLLLLQNSPRTITQSEFQKISAKYEHKITGVKKYLKNKKMIFDVGTGPTGSPWWKEIDEDASITGVDYFFFPTSVPKNVTIYKYNASNLDQLHKGDTLQRYISNSKFINEKVDLYNKFDIVIANHVLEHVDNPASLIEGASKLLKKNGILYVGFPDYRNFTDIFYHLIHPNGGGHIQQLTNISVKTMAKNSGFKLLECNIWPDDWIWFQSCYSPITFGVEHIDQHQLNYLCSVFRKELTPQKGYFYGWEMVFKKYL